MIKQPVISEQELGYQEVINHFNKVSNGYVFNILDNLTEEEKSSLNTYKSLFYYIFEKLSASVLNLSNNCISKEDIDNKKIALNNLRIFYQTISLFEMNPSALIGSAIYRLLHSKNQLETKEELLSQENIKEIIRHDYKAFTIKTENEVYSFMDLNDYLGVDTSLLSIDDIVNLISGSRKTSYIVDLPFGGAEVKEVIETDEFVINLEQAIVYPKDTFISLFNPRVNILNIKKNRNGLSLVKTA